MKICVPIREKTISGIRIELLKVAKKGDMAEVWLDQLGTLDWNQLGSLFKKSPVPIIAVCKRQAEKGRFIDSLDSLTGVLINAKKSGAKYVDIPVDMPKNLIKKIVQQRGSKVILSFHDFKGMPPLPALLKKAASMHALGADIIKIACHAKDVSEGLRMLNLAKKLNQEKIPHILIAMGRHGAMTRILAPLFGGTIMFAPLTLNKKTADGQQTVDQLRTAWSLIKY